MWICAKCDSEVDDGFEICWSCGTSVDGAQDPTFRPLESLESSPAAEGTALVQAAAAGPATATAEKLIAVATYWVPGQAHEVQCMLEADRIGVFIAYEFGIATDWFLDSATGSIKLQVAEPDVERARKVLADHPKESTPLPPPPPRERPPEIEVNEQRWDVPLPRGLSTMEALRFLESQLSALIDSKDVPDWKVNPSYHPDVIAFIQKHANNQGFVQKAQAMQRNRAKYYATMRAQANAPKPEPEPGAPTDSGKAKTPRSRLPDRAMFRALATRVLRLVLRLVKWVGILLVASVFLVLAGAMTYGSFGDKQVQDAIAEADSQDPNWTWKSLQANRKEIPEKDNAALVVEAVAKELPDDWLESDSSLPALRELKPTAPLTEPQKEQLRGLVKKHAAALAQAGRLAGMATGRYGTGSGDSSPLTTSFPGKTLQNVMDFLSLAALLQAENHDGGAALTSARAMLAAGRSVGEEPDPRAQLLRMNCGLRVCDSIERTLAQERKLSEPVLAVLQQDLQKEIDEPVLLHALRGQRVWVDHAFQRKEAGDDAAWVSAGGSAEDILGGIPRWFQRGWIKDNHGRGLQLMSQAVEIAKFPVEKQAGKFKEWTDSTAQLKAASETRFALVHPWPAEVLKTTATFQRTQARLRCTVAALALERWRLEGGAWPKSLDEAKKFLPEVPVGTCSGEPLALRFNEGVEVYTPGPDGTEISFRIWDAQRR